MFKTIIIFPLGKQTQNCLYRRRTDIILRLPDGGKRNGKKVVEVQFVKPYDGNIIRASGFNDPVYFYRCFHKAYHTTPERFRQNKLDKNDK